MTTAAAKRKTPSIEHPSCCQNTNGFVFSLAAKPHRGLAASETDPHPAPAVRNLRNAEEIEAELRQNRIGVICYGDEITSTSNDREKFATYTRDSYTGLDYADQRFYASYYGRFNTPDPYSGSMRTSNPLSWNRYSYTLGDPVNASDATGLDGAFEGYAPVGCETEVSQQCEEISGGYAGTSGGDVWVGAPPGPTKQGGDASPVDPTQGVFANDLGSVNSSNYLTFSGAYDLLNGAPGFGGSTVSTAGVNSAYQLACQHAANPCTDADDVSVQNRGGTVNILLTGNPLDPNSVANCWGDPLTSIFHSGSPSYYCGGNFLGNTGHLVDAQGDTGAHYDDPGPFNPLHWVTSLFAWASDPPQQYMCSVASGCSAKR